jgi:excinuclease ABC subunit A
MNDSPSPLQNIIIRGARQNNLKGIDVIIPRGKLVVITGPSGSGKSSLAFDTLYAEGQRRYVESLSTYARQFLEQLEKPDVDSIEGISPAISIEQKSPIRNPRSTVGTATEIFDHLRLLFARIGKPHCPKCKKPINPRTIQQIADDLLKYPNNTLLNIVSPVVRGKKGDLEREIRFLLKKGFVRVKIDGIIRDLGEEIAIDRAKPHDLDVIVDRIVLKEGIERRLIDSLEIASGLSDGIIKIEINNGNELTFIERLTCIDCGINIPELSPRSFSFNSPYGACPECDGLGARLFIDPYLIVPNRRLSLKEGAIAPWANRPPSFLHLTLGTIAKHYGFDLNTPFDELSPEVQDAILYGTKRVKIKDDKTEKEFPFEGVINELQRAYDKNEFPGIREEIERYMNFHPCPKCNGTRFKEEVLSVKIKGLNIHDFSRMTIRELRNFLQRMEMDIMERKIAEPILNEISRRLKFLEEVGLDYLTLDRASYTLSAGEMQRIHLASQLGSSLIGVIYLLDEPSIGLHQRDHRKLLNTLMGLKERGNTVIVVEHDPETILSSDYVIDLGPGSGDQGGEVVYSGKPDGLIEEDLSLTGQYLSGKKSISIPTKRRDPKGRFIVIKGARENNLKGISVKIPIGCFTCVTGVSGSGKSTLVVDTLYRCLTQYLYRSKERAGKVDEILGIHYIDRVINVDQSPLGRTPRSNPATYTGLFIHIRDLFAKLPESRIRGYGAGRYSFNVKGGRCEACRGDGQIRLEMHFLPDVYVVCESCKGKRYNRETLSVRYRGKSIADILEMSVEKASLFFENVPKIRSILQTLLDVGLGYITLGQPATTLSGGEAQRVKLSRELSKKATGKTLYILDEPTRGLHFAEIHRLLEVLNRLVDLGNTVVVIEHNLDVIKCADYIIDLGPEGGDRGGEVICEGTPEEVMKNERSYTGQFLRGVLFTGNIKGQKPLSVPSL